MPKKLSCVQEQSKTHECPRSFPAYSDAVLWAALVLDQPKGAPAATVAPLVLSLPGSMTTDI
jgi:hypothetical protein